MADKDLEDLMNDLDGPEEPKEEPKKAAAPKKRRPSPKTTKPKTKRIILEENEEIPPTGLYLGHNGRGYIIQVGEPVDVPLHILEILDNAVMSQPRIDPQTARIVGYRTRMRYPYRVVNS